MNFSTFSKVFLILLLSILTACKEQKKETDKFIQNIIGNYEIFIYTNLFLQQREKSFRDLTTAEKKKFLYEIFGYNWFEKFEKEKKEQLKTVSVEEKHLKSLTEKYCLVSFDEKIQKYTNIIACINIKIIFMIF